MGSFCCFFQHRTLYELKMRFESNRNRIDKHALNGEELQEFYGLCVQLVLDFAAPPLDEKTGMQRGWNEWGMPVISRGR